MCMCMLILMSLCAVFHMSTKLRQSLIFPPLRQQFCGSLTVWNTFHHEVNWILSSFIYTDFFFKNLMLLLAKHAIIIEDVLRLLKWPLKLTWFSYLFFKNFVHELFLMEISNLPQGPRWVWREGFLLQAVPGNSRRSSEPDHRVSALLCFAFCSQPNCPPIFQRTVPGITLIEYYLAFYHLVQLLSHTVRMNIIIFHI